jgi:hypothetical protein
VAPKGVLVECTTSRPLDGFQIRRVHHDDVIAIYAQLPSRPASFEAGAIGEIHRIRDGGDLARQRPEAIRQVLPA